MRNGIFADVAIALTIAARGPRPHAGRPVGFRAGLGLFTEVIVEAGQLITVGGVFMAIPADAPPRDIELGFRDSPPYVRHIVGDRERPLLIAS